MHSQIGAICLPLSAFIGTTDDVNPIVLPHRSTDLFSFTYFLCFSSGKK